MAILKDLRAGTSDRIRLTREGLQVRVVEIRGGRARVAIEPLKANYPDTHDQVEGDDKGEAA